MPEPQFNVPTVYSPATLGFNFPKSTNKPKKARKQQSVFGSLIGYKTNDQFALDAVNNALSYPQSQTVNVDGSTGVLANLKGAAAAILNNMGSSGDAPVQATKASYTTGGSSASGGGILGDPIVLIGLVFGAGVVIYLANK